MLQPRPKVLVVEDDEALAHVYCTALVFRGVEPRRAADGLAALRALEANRPDLIVLDLMLPTVSGWTILAELSENPLTSDIPIIVVTGVDPTPDLPHAIMVLRKPCDPGLVAKMVTDHLGPGA